MMKPRDLVTPISLMEVLWHSIGAVPTTTAYFVGMQLSVLHLLHTLWRVRTYVQAQHRSSPYNYCLFRGDATVCPTSTAYLVACKDVRTGTA